MGKENVKKSKIIPEEYKGQYNRDYEKYNEELEKKGDELKDEFIRASLC